MCHIALITMLLVCGDNAALTLRFLYTATNIHITVFSSDQGAGIHRTLLAATHKR